MRRIVFQHFASQCCSSFSNSEKRDLSAVALRFIGRWREFGWLVRSVHDCLLRVSWWRGRRSRFLGTCRSDGIDRLGNFNPKTREAIEI
jgi:hypothetical protein